MCRLTALAVLVSAAACEQGLPAGSCDGDRACACGPGIDSPAFEGQTHVPESTSVAYAANPPASGNHWPQWDLTWGTYTTALPRERWMHNLEHGGVVLLYNCPAGCASEVAELTSIKNGRPPDKYGVVRIIVTPDAKLPTPFAAVAWRFRWQGDSVDAATLKCFIDARYDRAPESLP